LLAWMARVGLYLRTSLLPRQRWRKIQTQKMQTLRKDKEMKYTGYTKPQLIEWCQCLEHNYNVEKERFERVSGIAQKLAAQIVELRALLNEVRDILYNYKHCFQAKDLEKTNDLLSGIHAVFDENVNNMFQTEQDVANNVAKSDLQHSEPNCNIMLKNPEDFNTSDENVKGDDR